MLRLGSVAVDPPLVLAPMAGITDHVYRLMLRSDRRRGAGHHGVHLLGGHHAGKRPAASQAPLLRGGAPALDPDLRVGPGAHGGGGRDRRGAAARRLRHQHGLPGQQGPEGVRRCGADGRPRPGAPDHPGGPRAPVDPAHGQVPAGARRRAPELPRARPHLRGRRRRRRGPARPDGPADVHGPRRLDPDRGVEARRLDPRRRQRRHRDGRGRGRDVPGDRLRRRHVRAARR